MSASDYVLGWRYGGLTRRSPVRFGGDVSPAGAAAGEFASRARASSRVLCPGCRFGSVVQELDDRGLVTGRWLVVAAVPAADVRSLGRLEDLASSVALSATVESGVDPVVTTVAGGRVVTLVPFWFRG